MATTQTQLRRGTNAQVNAMTPAEGEVVVDMTNDRLCLGDGIRAGGFPIPNFSDNQKNSFGYGVSSGTANALTLALSPALLAYVEGVTIEFRSGTTNTGAATINVNGLGAISIRQQDLSVLTAGVITSGRNYKLTYNGTYFLIMNAAPAASSESGLVFLGTAGVSGGNINVTSMLDNSLYTRYKLAWDRITLNASGTNLTVRVSENNGSSYLSGSQYRIAAATDGTAIGAAQTQWSLYGTGSGSSYSSGELTLGNTDSASASHMKMQGILNDTTSINKFGAVTHTGDINAVRFLPNVGGAIASGQVYVYGYAK